jgi:hypothetical protein
MNEAAEANKKAQDALAKFCDKYGSYKTTLKTDTDWVDWVFSPFKFINSLL